MRTGSAFMSMEVNRCSNCGLVNLEGDRRCQRCNDLLPEPGQTVSWTKVAPPPIHNWMNDSASEPKKVAPIKPNLFPCPDCSQSVSVSAYSCPHCGRPFKTRTTQQTAIQPTVQPAVPYAQPPVPLPYAPPQQVHYHYPYPYPAPQAWSPGVAAVLSLFMPGVGQMYKGRVGEGVLWLIFTPIGYVLFILPGLILHIICIITASQGNPYRQGG